MLMKIEQLSQLMKKEKILHCEYEDGRDVVKITLDPQSLYQPEEISKQDIVEKINDDYDEFLFQTKKLKEAKLRAELENL